VQNCVLWDNDRMITTPNDVRTGLDLTYATPELFNESSVAGHPRKAIHITFRQRLSHFTY